MSRGINKVILVGSLGKDPEVKYLPNGNAVANISLATSESWKDRNTGQKQEKTEWHRIVVFGKLAEIAGQYLTNGAQAYFEGTTEIVVDSRGQMQMLGGNTQTRSEPNNTYTPNAVAMPSNNNFSSQNNNNQTQFNNSNQFQGQPNTQNVNQNQFNNQNQFQGQPPSNNQTVTNPPKVEIDFDDDIPF